MFKRNYENILKAFMNYLVITITFFTTIAITLKSPENIKYKNILVILFCITSFLSAIYLVLTTLKKGYIPLECQEYEINEYCDKYCARCKMYVPDRAYHCRTCKRCIKRMNYHCSWVGRCVNNDNLAYFIRYLFFSTLSYTVSSIIYFFYIYEFIKKHSISGNFVFLFLISLHCVITLIISIITFTIFVFNLLLVIKNVTVIEKRLIFELEELGIKIDNIPFDFGIFRNLTNLLGKPYFLFLYGENVGDGFHFKENDVFDFENDSLDTISDWCNNGSDV